MNTSNTNEKVSNTFTKNKNIKTTDSHRSTKKIVTNYYDELKVLTYGDTKYKEFIEENIEVNRLNFIVSNRALFESKLRANKANNGKADKYDQFLLSSKILSRTRNRSLKVTYKQNRGVGRNHAVGSISLQCIKRQIRHTIAIGYTDIDMVNAHPNILKFVCEQNDIPCPILTKYCNNREQFFEDNKLTKAQGKLIFLCVINGGFTEYNALPNPSKDLTKFAKSEILIIHNLIAAKHSELYEDHKKMRIAKGENHNHKASFMNIILCDIENKILMTMHEYFGSSSHDVLCFDGLMVTSDKKHDLKGCEKAIFDKYQIQIKLAIKPFDEAFDLSSFVVPIYTEISLSCFQDRINLSGKPIELEMAKEWLDNSIVWIDNSGKGYFLTKNKDEDCITTHERIFYEPMKKEVLLSTLNVDCDIENPNFDFKYWSEHKNDKNKSDLNAEKMKKLLFSKLGPNKGETRGYIETLLGANQIPIYSYVEFMPFLRRKGVPNLKRKFNTFTGYPMERVKLTTTYDFTKSKLYKHIKEQLMGDDEGEFNHFLDHVADMIQDPANIKTNGHLFVSGQGMGKGILAEFIFTLIGIDYCVSFENTEAYFSNFNANQGNKILKLFEEVSSKGAAFKNHDRLKADQSKKTERIEPKGIDAYKLRHCARYWYFSNNKDCLFIEGDDRRYTCHRSKDTHANDIDYFEPIWKEIRDVQFCKNAFEFFANRTYTFKSVITCYDNKFKREQKEQNLCNTHQFLKEFAENNCPLVITLKKGPIIKCTDLHDAYKVWCTNNGKPYNMSTFKTQFDKFNIVMSGQRIEGKTYRCYSLDKNILREKFAIFLKDPNFQFIDLDHIDEDDEIEIEQKKQTTINKQCINKKTKVENIDDVDDIEETNDYETYCIIQNLSKRLF